MTLRRLRSDDLESLARLYADEEVRRYFPDGTLTREETRREIAWFADGHPDDPQLGLWAMIHRETGAFLGRAGLLPWTIDGEPELEVAYLLDRGWWGRGLATEAARAIVEHAFGALGRTRLVCLIDPENLASQRVAERIGMRLERRLDGVDGDGVPTLLFARHKWGRPD